MIDNPLGYAALMSDDLFGGIVMPPKVLAAMEAIMGAVANALPVVALGFSILALLRHLG